ncbi:MAG TPA: hypothetical protein PKC69_00440 [Chitinophagaceae bacterium]|nr:hypothetical protein [Chitinophagaceae bacterium]
MHRYLPLWTILFFITACHAKPKQPLSLDEKPLITKKKIYRNDSAITIHILVALCDNQYQGIVKVPAGIGNGQQPATNLYWGAGYGISNFFKHKSSDWKLVETFKQVSDTILERLLFKHTKANIYLLADACDGRYIRQTTIDFLGMASGKNEVTIQNGNHTLYFGGASRLVAYVGHDGLMDFSLEEEFSPADTLQRDVMVLACYSKRFFSPHLKQTGARPVLWTTHLMAPEAYTLHDALAAWIKGESGTAVADAAAAAYARYQKCSFKTARKLLVSGW